MSLPDPRDKLMLLRHILGPLVDGFELDDPGRGVVGTIKVAGGVLLHPLSRETLPEIKVYGAGPDRVKIIEPRFLRSLAPIVVSGLGHPSQFCARVAGKLGNALNTLGQIRDSVATLGINLDLEHDLLRLSGRLDVEGISLRLSAWEPGKLVVCGVGEHDLTGLLPRAARTIELSGNAPADLDELTKLTRRIDERFRRETVAELERSLEVFSSGDQPQIAVEPVRQQAAAPEPVAPEPAAPEPGTGDSGAATPAAGGFAAGKSDVLELTETVEDAQAQQPRASLGPLRVAEIIDKLGSETVISAFGGKLRMEIQLKVIHGNYRFYLEQQGQSLLRGYLITPGGQRHNVEFDLQRIMDIKEVLDRVLMSV